MLETGKYRNRTSLKLWDSRDVSGWMHRLACGFGPAVFILCCWPGYGGAADAPAASAAPTKIAVFAFELEDFTAAREQGVSPGEISYLAQSTEEAKQQLLQSGRYNLIDIAVAD